MVLEGLEAMVASQVSFLPLAVQEGMLSTLTSTQTSSTMEPSLVAVEVVEVGPLQEVLVVQAVVEVPVSQLDKVGEVVHPVVRMESGLLC